MKKIFLVSFISLLILQIIGCTKNKETNSSFFKYNSEQIFIQDLHKLKIVKHLNDNLYSFVFIEDSIPYLDKEDSLFYINLRDNKSILFYNSNLYQNTGFILYGDLIKKDFNLVRTYTINDASAYYLNGNIILRIEESVHPLITQNSYFLMNNSSNYPLNNNIKILTKGSYWLPDSTGIFNEYVDMQIKDSLSENNIYLKGIIKNNIEKLKWDSIKIINENKIISKKVKAE